MTPFKIITTLLTLTIVLLTACKKDSPVPETVNSGFDINNPEGYYIYLKRQNAEGTNATCEVLEFMPAKSVKFYSMESDGDLSTKTYNYSVIDNSILDIPADGGGSVRIEIKNGKVSGTNVGEAWKDVVLLKKPDTNPFSGKIFSGKYYKKDNSILHNSFFYRFDAYEPLLYAWVNSLNDAREDGYELIGNFAAYNTNISGYPGDVEFIVAVGNTLRANYYDDINNRKLYGEFTQQ